MSRQAKIYVILTATLGVIVLERAGAPIHPSGDVRFLCYLVAAVFTSQLKVRLPGVPGTLSVNFFFLMLGILDLDIRQVLMLACAGTLGQMWWHAHPRPRPMQMVFNLASVTVASYGAFHAYHWHVLQALSGSPPVSLIASTVLFFLANTLAVSGVLALTERERQVLVLIANGKSTKEAAAQLGISYKTADSHRSRILEKLGVHETASMVRYAIRAGLIEP